MEANTLDIHLVRAVRKAMKDNDIATHREGDRVPRQAFFPSSLKINEP